MNEITSTQDELKKIFETLNIAKVVYIDDDFDIEFEKILLPGNRELVLSEYFPMITAIDEDIQNRQIREQWEKLDYKTMLEINKNILSRDNSLTEIDNKATSAFFEIIPQEILSPISPHQWEKEKKRLLEDSENTLFLFDQDLKNEDGFKEDGIKIISEITQNQKIICALFTQTVSRDRCMQARDELSEKYTIPKKNFFVIPKEILPNDVSYFIYLLKMTILTGDFSSFKNIVNTILETTVEKVKESMEKIGIEDFDHIMFKAPEREGQWEPDMFFRLYSHYQRREFYTKAYSDKTLRKIISKIRLTSNIPAKTTFMIPSKAWEIQHDELYENSEYLNKNHLPLELGDIFEKTDSKNSKKYILLAQSCDLMIRGKGYRARDNNRLALLEITDFNEKQYKTIFEEEVVYFGDSPDQKWFVKFKSVHFIKDYILDLCAYNDDGVAKFDPAVNAKDDIHLPLINRYSLIRKKIEKKVQKGEKLIGKDYENDNTNEFMRILFCDDIFQGKYEKTDKGYTIIYNCKRIGRLNRARATGLLMSYTSTIQRPAYEMDFGHFEESSS
jgi:hypothetical protein